MVYDGDTKIASYSYPAGWFGGEAAFAPRAGATMREDDGYLVTFVAEEATGVSELYVFDVGPGLGRPGRAAADPAAGSDRLPHRMGRGERDLVADRRFRRLLLDLPRLDSRLNTAQSRVPCLARR